MKCATLTLLKTKQSSIISLSWVFTWVNKPNVADVIHIPNCTTGSWSHPITMHIDDFRRIWRKKKCLSNNTVPVGNFFLFPKQAEVASERKSLC